MSRKVYEVDVTRDGGYWVIRVPEVERTTQARTLEDLDAMARDLVSIMTDAEPDAFDLDIVVKVPPAALEHLELSMNYREIASDANAKGAEEMRLAVRELVQGAGFTVRDVSRLLGVSHQRVHQLAQEPVGHDVVVSSEAALESEVAEAVATYNARVRAYNEKLADQATEVRATEESPRLVGIGA